jgi:trimethylamine--corrinoid protein Co-methyltransferase
MYEGPSPALDRLAPTRLWGPDFPLSRKDVQAVHDASVAVLEKTGVRFASDTALALFRAHGFRVEGQRVFFTEADLWKALDTVPRRFTILARNPRHHIAMEPGVVVFGLGRGAVTFVEPDGSYHHGTTADVIAASKLCQRLAVLELWGPLVYPADIPPADANLWLSQTMIRYTDKPYHYSHRDDIDLVAMAYGTTREGMAARSDLDHSYGQTTATVTSPLSLSPDECDNLMEYARCGIAFHIASMPIGGTTGPCTLAGVVVQQNCENLAAIVLAQLVRPGCPVFYGTIGGHADMRSLRPLFGTAETRLIERAGSQMTDLYGLFCRGNVALTDAPVCDFQAGAQAMLHTLHVLQNGPNILPGCGLLGSYLGASLAKIVLDVELITATKRFLTPIRPDRETLAVEVIADAAPRGEFITHEHTLRHYATEFLSGGVFVSTNYDQWAAAGGKEAKHLAHETAQMLIDSYVQPPLDPGLAEEMDAYVKRHWHA